MRRPPVRVLAYHSLTPWPGDPLGVAPGAFAEQMDWLERTGWRCLSLEGWVRHLKEGTSPEDPSFVLTFDDGYADVLEYGAPILRERDFHATLFVVTGAMEHGAVLSHDRKAAAGRGAVPPRRSVTWEEALAWRDLGFAIGSHTCTHARLTELDGRCRMEELRASAAALKRRFGSTPPHFCYPHGDLDRQVIADARAAGYQAAVVTPSFAAIPATLWTIHRVGIYGHDDLIRFRLKLGACFPALRAARHRMAGRVLEAGRVAKSGPARVLELTTSSGCGGIEGMMTRLLPALAKVGVHAEVLALDRGGPAERAWRARGITVRGLRARHVPAQLAALRKLLAGEGFDIVHAYGTRATVIARLAAAACGAARPRVITGVLSTNDGRGPHHLLLDRLTRRWNDLHLSNSHACMRALTGDRNGGENRAARVLYDGIEAAPRRPRRSPEEIRSALGLAASSRVLICVANLRPMKGHLVLFRGFEKVLARGIDARLLLVGEDRMNGRLHREARARFEDGRVLFLGLRDDVDDLLAASDLFVLASDWEGLPVSLLEAMRAGLPIVATSVSGIPEAIRNGENGILVPPRDPDALGSEILRLLDDPDRARRMGEKGRERFLSRFTIDRMSRELASIYEEHAGRSGAGPDRVETGGFESGRRGGRSADDGRHRSRCAGPRARRRRKSGLVARDLSADLVGG